MTWEEFKSLIDDVIEGMGYLDNEVQVNWIEVTDPGMADDFTIYVEAGALVVTN